MERKELIGALIVLQIETTLALACIIATSIKWNSSHAFGAIAMTILSVLGYRELIKKLFNNKNNKSNGI